VSGKICQECRKAFEPARKSQRFCSVRCGNRQRDRRRRHRAPIPGTAISEATSAEAPALKTRDSTVTRLTAVQPESRRNLDSLQTKLRTQSEELDHLEADVSEHRATIESLHGEIARLHDIRQSDDHDLIRRRIWTATTRRTKAKHR
jgi:predicted RNase H-like nuclease (RuvC/YqgF family)